MVQNVYVSAVTPDNISRHELLAWVNNCLQSALSKIEEMSTGAAYCQLTDLLFPGDISLKKIKFNSRNEVDHINNWKVLQTAWKNIGIDKPVPVERLLRGKFQENFEFLQWFKKFFDANYQEREYDAVAARGGEALPIGAKGAPGGGSRVAATRAPASAPRAAAPPAARRPAAPVAAATRAAPARTSGAAAAPAPAAAAAAPAVDAPPPGLIKDLEDKVEAYMEATQTAERERDFYFDKLRRVEDLCQAANGEKVAPDAILKILYETEDGEAPIEDAGAIEDATAAPNDDEKENGGLPSAPTASVDPPSASAPIAAAAAPAPVNLLDDDETF